jgi:hypothetical protein
MSIDERERLASLQAELVSALTGRTGPPEGFDPDRLGAAARSLSRKRARSVARAWPSLADALGEDFEPCFAAYIAEAPLPRRGGPLADGRNFARFLARRGILPDAARLEVLSVDLRYASRPMGLVPRRGPALAVALLGHPRRLILAVRWPGRRIRRATIPLGHRIPPR